MTDETRKALANFRAAVLKELDEMETADDPHASFTWVPKHGGDRATHNLSCPTYVIQAGKELIEMGFARQMGIPVDEVSTDIFAAPRPPQKTEKIYTGKGGEA